MDLETMEEQSNRCSRDWRENDERCVVHLVGGDPAVVICLSNVASRLHGAVLLSIGPRTVCLLGAVPSRLCARRLRAHSTRLCFEFESLGGMSVL